MVGVRKVMEKFFSEKDLKYLDDKMPDFHLRKKEDMKKRKSQTAVSVVRTTLETPLEAP